MCPLGVPSLSQGGLSGSSLELVLPRPGGCIERHGRVASAVRHLRVGPWDSVYHPGAIGGVLPLCRSHVYRVIGCCG